MNSAEAIAAGARVIDRAVDVFGSPAAAVAFMDALAIALDRMHPADLLGTDEGLKPIKAYLGRLDRGVYT